MCTCTEDRGPRLGVLRPLRGHRKSYVDGPSAAAPTVTLPVKVRPPVMLAPPVVTVKGLSNTLTGPEQGTYAHPTAWPNQTATSHMRPQLRGPWCDGAPHPLAPMGSNLQNVCCPTLQEHEVARRARHSCALEQASRKPGGGGGSLQCRVDAARCRGRDLNRARGPRNLI